MSPMMKIVLFLTVVFAEEICTGGKVFKECGSACPLTCGEPIDKPCTMQCVAECQCPDGLFWNEAAQQCVKYCPKARALEDAKCTGGKVFKECGSACPLTCGEPILKPCTKQCVAECQCPDGLFWNEAAQQCVKYCPKARALEDAICTGGKVFKECGSACPLTCGEPILKPCTRQCVAECQCPGHMFWNEAAQSCVKYCPRHQPRLRRQQEVCTGGKVFNECGTACPLECGKPIPEICTDQCVAECQCPDGLFWNEAAQQCVKYCPKARALEDAKVMKRELQGLGNIGGGGKGSLTPLKRELQGRGNIGLGGGKGTLTPVKRELQNNSVGPETRVLEDAKCTGGQVFMECGTACPLECGKPIPETCTLQCVAECQCPGGLFWNGETCVKQCKSESETTSESETESRNLERMDAQAEIFANVLV